MLEVRNITSGYGGAQALWDVSLSVGDGEIVTIIGPNGAGKSTLVNVMAGMHPCWSGDVVFDGTDLTSLSPHRVVGEGVAVVPEGRQVF
ncbi:MAG: ATP-binding cassette domain-containing protein, partial [Acidimicrobiia bacterium]|nr:ATP-binding cassette domain-containing protein [Acidimicrobiia bacterium]